MIINNCKKIILIIIGTISLAIGIIGIFIPLLPTTPLLLLSGFCYVRSSERLYNWLINHRVFGSYIYNYMHHRAVNNRAKVLTLLLLWISLTVSFVLIDVIYARIFLIIVGLSVSAHILLLKNMRRIVIEPVTESDQESDDLERVDNVITPIE